MKKKTLENLLALVITLSAVGLGLGLTQGCKTTTTIDANGQTNSVTRVDPVKTAEAIKVVIAAGVPFAIEQDTNAIPYLQAAALVFKAAANSGDYDPAQVQLALNRISVKELRDPQARVLVVAVLGVYKVTLGDAVTAKLNESQWAIPVLNAIADGITAALPGQP